MEEDRSRHRRALAHRCQPTAPGNRHLFNPAPVAASIGWPTSPFQAEVGLANISYGVLGVTASSFERPYTLAAIHRFLDLHARHGRRSRPLDGAPITTSPLGTPAIFWYDILAPLLLIVLYVATG